MKTKSLQSCNDCFLEYRYRIVGENVGLVSEYLPGFTLGDPEGKLDIQVSGLVGFIVADGIGVGRIALLG